eukprot:4723897-Prymnesium_polylepis.1
MSGLSGYVWISGQSGRWAGSGVNAGCTNSVSTLKRGPCSTTRAAAMRCFAASAAAPSSSAQCQPTASSTGGRRASFYSAREWRTSHPHRRSQRYR